MDEVGVRLPVGPPHMNKFTFQELKEDEAFDPNTLYPGTPFTQAAFYGHWQKNLGRTVRRFLMSEDGNVVAYVQLITYPLMAGKSYLYAPYGPVVINTTEKMLQALKIELLRIAREEDAVFVRLDFTPPTSSSGISNIFTPASRRTYHSSYFQPRTEWFLPLGKSEYDLLSDMHKHTRYSIRTGEQREVTAEIVTENFQNYFAAFYALMAETATRNGFHLHPKKYYEGIFESLPHIPGSYLSVARLQDTILAVNLIIVFGNVAMHVFGGSSSEERQRMPAYVAQWKSICHAKSIGCTDYNFGGISSKGDPHTGWEGLTAFKQKFGGHEVTHSDFFDVVVRPFWYRLYIVRKFLQRR